MLPCVPGQLIGPGKPPPAALEAADVGLLTSVGPHVSLEVAGLAVRLHAPLGGTVVDHELPLGPHSLLPWLWRLVLVCPAAPAALGRLLRGRSLGLGGFWRCRAGRHARRRRSRCGCVHRVISMVMMVVKGGGVLLTVHVLLLLQVLLLLTTGRRRRSG